MKSSPRLRVGGPRDFTLADLCNAQPHAIAENVISNEAFRIDRNARSLPHSADL